MRTYYTTIASTWGSQSYESYTGSDFYSTETSTYTNYAGSVLSSTSQSGQSSWETTSHNSTALEVYSKTEKQATTTYSRVFSTTESSSQTEYFADTYQTQSISGSYAATSCETYSYVSVEKTIRNLISVTYSTYFSEWYSDSFSDTYTVLDRQTIGTVSITADTSSSTFTNTVTNSVTNYDTTSNVETTSSYEVGSQQVTTSLSRSYETTITILNAYLRTYGSTNSSGAYTYVSYFTDTVTTSGGATASSQTTTVASSTITVTFNPRAQQAIVYERSTEERMFLLTKNFDYATVLISQALSEKFTHTERFFTSETNTSSDSFTGSTFSSTTSSADVSRVGSQATEFTSPFTYVQSGKTVEITWDKGVFEVTSQVVGGTVSTARLTMAGYQTTSFTDRNVTIWPRNYFTFDSTGTSYVNEVFAYTTTQLANL